MAGATTGRASTLAGRPASGTESKWWASSGAVATVAATVMATPSASACALHRSALGIAGASSSTARRSTLPRGIPKARMPTTAAKESCQPGSAHARGFQASVAAAASSSAYERDDGLEAAIAAMPARPITPARWSDGPAPASGT